ncbi:hypothetical protein AALP_AAs40836U000200 [Arabis alpina]|uniref:Uncharacterized protein n=1 Tax=Arabis alpina TaxID=50452 RepID=A0A087FWU7_ARAAL|nr:hypothetical protein AALP_AAs40836U000200 [Arabis alpina]
MTTPSIGGVVREREPLAIAKTSNVRTYTFCLFTSSYRHLYNPIKTSYKVGRCSLTGRVVFMDPRRPILLRCFSKLHVESDISQVWIYPLLRKTPITTKIFESLSTSSTPKRNASLGVDHETPPVNFDLCAFLTEIKASSSIFAPIYANTSEQAGVNLRALTLFADEKSLDTMMRVCRMSEELGFLALRSHERPWDCPAGYICLHEQMFTDCFLWFSLPYAFVRYFGNRNICFSQMTMAETCNLVALLVLGAELDINFSVKKYEQISLMKEGQVFGRFYNIMKAGCKFIKLKSKIGKWFDRYFFVKINDASVQDTTRTYHSRWNPSMVPHPPAPPLTDLPFREDLNMIRAGNHRWDNLSYNCILLARDRLGGDPICQRWFPEDSFSDQCNRYVKGDDASARGSVPDELNKPKGCGDASRSKGKGKVDTVDKKAEKKRISAKAKADLEAGRIHTFRIGGTCEVLLSEALVAQSLGVIPFKR